MQWFLSPQSALSRYSFAAHSDGCNAIASTCIFLLTKSAPGRSTNSQVTLALLCEVPPSHWAVPLFLLIYKIPLYSEDESTLCFMLQISSPSCGLPFAFSLVFYYFFVIQNILKIFLFHRKAFNPLRIKFFTGWELGI